MQPVRPPPSSPLPRICFTLKPKSISFSRVRSSCARPSALTLTFSEAVRKSSFDFTAIGLQDSTRAFVSANETESKNKLQLTGGNITTSDGPVVRIVLTHTDLNTIKRIAAVATADTNTYLTIREGGVQDLSGNNVTAIVDGSALRVNIFTPDTTDPVLNSFDFIMGEYGSPLRMLLYFSETVNVTTLDTTKFVLQSHMSSAFPGFLSRRLTGGNPTPLLT